MIKDMEHFVSSHTENEDSRNEVIFKIVGTIVNYINANKQQKINKNQAQC